MVGGTVADLFRAKQRGLAMNVFVLLNFIGGVGNAFFLCLHILINRAWEVS